MKIAGCPGSPDGKKTGEKACFSWWISSGGSGILRTHQNDRRNCHETGKQLAGGPEKKGYPGPGMDPKKSMNHRIPAYLLLETIQDPQVCARAGVLAAQGEILNGLLEGREPGC